MIKTFSLTFIFLWAFVNLNWAQAPKFESFKLLKNLNSVQVNAIEQDALGFIWLGTNNGLIKYDGVVFTQYTEQDSLYNNIITSLTFDSINNCLWIGHENGKISVLNKYGIHKFNPEEGLSTREISSIYIDSKGILWFNTLNEGIYFYKGKNRKRLYNLNTDDGLLDNYVYNMCQYNDSIYYFATDKGISVYNINSKLFFDEITTQDGLPDNLVKDIEIHPPYLWIGMHDGGVCRYHLDKKTFSHIAPWDFGALNHIQVTNNNEIYVCTDKNGVVKIQYDKKHHAWYSNYKKNHGLSDVRTKTLFYDREHNLWIGTKKGLSIRKNNNIEFFDNNSGFNLSQVFSITLDHNNRFWLATQDGLFIHYRDEMGYLTTKQILDIPEFELALFISVYTDYYGNVWAGTYGFGALCINPITLEYKVYSTKNNLASNDVFNITGDSLNIWFSTAGGGVSRLSLSDYSSFTNFNTENGLSSNYVFSIYLENPNKAWLATDGGGISIIEFNKAFKYKNTYLDSLGSKVYGIVPDTSGNIWVNIAEHGIFSINQNNESIHLNEINKLSSSNVQAIICNFNNQIVAASNQGIDIIDINSLFIEKYGEESGVSYLKPNLNAIYKDRQDNIYIGTATGMLKYNNHIHDTLIKPQLIITSKRLFLNEVSEGEHKFNYKQNNFSFGFTALWYQSPEPLLYRYKLEGYDMDWSPESTVRTVTYPKLPHGSYKFVIQAKLPSGVWVKSKAGTYSFHIKPPFWKTPWFIILIVILGVLAVYAFINYRTRKLLRDKEILENEVVKRTAEIWQQKEEIESQRDEIEAQRNYVVEQHEKIQIQHKDIQASITYASRIQQAVLPPMENFDKLLPEYFVFFKPRDIVSGDFYYLNTAHNKVIIAAADCTGHGVPGAFMSLLGVSLLNQIVGQLPNKFKACDILNELRSEIKKALRQDNSDGSTKDGMDISLSVIDFKNKNLDFAGAFNPLLIIRNGEALEYKGDKMPIGVFMKDFIDFKNIEIELFENDMLYMYSDGFQDQFGGDKNRKFLPKRLRALLLENSSKPMNEQSQILDKTLTKWKGETHQIDDILIIGIRI